ncbi:MAG: Fe-S cluster assembly protein SufD [Deltaproteobacteria bacterium]|nr:Fe-S cluster assembly protein SufD [Deltaproteobacteria bacterium]
MNVAEKQSELKKWYQLNFQTFEQSLNGSKASPLHSVRVKAFEAFVKNGFPTPRTSEDWKYTNLQPIVKNDFELAAFLKSHQVSIEDVNKLALAKLAGDRLVFLDGVFAPILSEITNQKGLSVRSFSDLEKSSDKQHKDLLSEHLTKYVNLEEYGVAALNTGFVNDGALIEIEEGAEIEKPIQLLFISTVHSRPTVSYPRVLLVSRKDSKATVIENYKGFGQNTYFTCAVTEAFLDESADIKHYKILEEGSEATHYGHMAVVQSAKSKFSTSSFSYSGKLIRNEVTPILNGEEIECHLYGLSVLSEEQHVDNFTVIDHKKPNCHSNELYKGIYKDKSRGVFSGTIIVRPDAQKTDAIQSNQAILLSEDAEVDARPQLKIWADDVKCTHGATVGQIDQDALFYLRARGISEVQAKHMLMQAFAIDIFQEIEDDFLRESLENRFLELL